MRTNKKMVESCNAKEYTFKIPHALTNEFRALEYKCKGKEKRGE